MSKDFTLIIFVVLATLSSGLLGSAALAAVRGSARIPLKAIVSSGAVSLAVGAGLSLATLGHPELFLGALSHVGTGIFWQLFGSIVCFTGAVVFLVLSFRDDEGPALKVFAVLAAAGALIAVVGVGRSFVMPWRLAWASWSIVGVFLGFALSSVACFSLFLNQYFEEHQSIPAWLRGVAVLLCPLSLVWYLTSIGLSSEPAAGEILSRALIGGAAPIFWAMALGGVLAPVLCLSVRSKGRFVGLAGSLVSAVGAGAFQYLLLLLDTPAWQFFVR